MSPSLLLPRSLLVIILVIVLAFLIERWGPSKTQISRQSGEGCLHPVSYAQNSTGGTSRPLERISVQPLTSKTPDTTAIILNWSRLPNVIRIVGLLCQTSLNQSIADIVVWNNSPTAVTHEDFAITQCTKDRLTIYNSPANLYFYARFIACSKARTRYCFIQDDDYLVLPDIINALHSEILTTSVAGIHLLPAHEKLSSDLRTIRIDARRHTSFAWLGHGAIIHRRRAIDFLSLMDCLNASEDELKMADNYFTILSNTFVVTWFDQGIELGGGQPFTVGNEGEGRNRHHIIRATEMLEYILTNPNLSCLDDGSALPYVQREYDPDPPLHRAPCLGSTCVLETSINMLPDTINRSCPHLTQMLAHEAANMNMLGEGHKVHYVTYPPSNAVDGDASTAFCSFDNAKEGDMILLKHFRKISLDRLPVELTFLIDVDTEEVLRAAAFEMLVDENWVTSDRALSCLETRIEAVTAKHSMQGWLQECAMEFPLGANFNAGPDTFRVRLPRNVEERWCVYEIWVRGVRR